MVEATNDLTVIPDTRKCLLLANERGNPWTVYLVNSSNQRKDGVESERGGQLVPTSSPSATAVCNGKRLTFY